MKRDVLDQGYVELVEHWGSDERIIEAARMSTQKGFKGWGPAPCSCCAGASLNWPIDKHCPNCHGKGVPGDEKLLKYLWEHKHYTPFEMAGLTLEVQAPIFVFREWHRHRTQSYNEMSGRYTVLPDMFYTPSVERTMAAKQGVKNKQGSEGGFTWEEAGTIRGALTQAYYAARTTYEGLLEKGVAREIARLVLPVAQYSKMRASANLRNWLQFLALRLPENAQYEIRQYAGAVAIILEDKFPRTMTLFRETNG